MKFQLVFQLPASSIQDYDEMIGLEEQIESSLGDLGYVDGHDMGSGEVNIFIVTDKPDEIFQHIKPILLAKDLMPKLKVAYREIGKSKFTIIYPLQLVDFKIM
jgi:hypothetical protein